ncbi:1-deoxy-D-xylulose-5-phosphate synthase [Kamptonema cortianum]|nr:1-deoxy-D-xylulose-5-phosphate synthase [Geitlerinema splendidum]MDK3155329.1 1-deoxy-D-xylulose-5-phosphate synthase [Kamptonema cortianum]
MDQVYPILSKIVSPTDLHKLSDKELHELAREVRQAILDKISRTGGHFSSNLGTVELTVALYAAYSIPPDKVIWDTGHQAYPHKLLTGRLPRFETMRKHKGLSGFLKRDEHELDVFGAGHAGTAISAAVGFAEARDKLGTSERVIAITGDAAISAGMSWEALNHAGELGTDMMVVLNDNRMSIAPNVGALTSYFTRLRSRSYVQDIAQKAKALIERIPGPAPRIAAGLRHGVTHYFAPEDTGTVFEELGFEYIGPVDGHDLQTLLEIFRNLRQVRAPLFVHAITTKGKGYEKAEEDATKWHGVVPFDLSKCELPSKTGSSYTNVFGSAIAELAAEDPKIVAITAAMPDGTGLTEFAKQFPKQYVDVGIAEQHGVTYSAGIAAGGMKPFCTIYSTFLQRGYDQVLHDVCIQNLPVRFAMDRAGLVGDDGPTHHGAFDISYLTHIPNMTLCAPRDATELREMMRFMADYNSGPIAVRYPRGGTPENLPESRTSIEFGKAEILGIPGTRRGQEPEKLDAVIVAIGSMVTEAWEAAKELAEGGLQVAVINGRWCKPIDSATIAEWARRTDLLISIEENVRIGGFGQQLRDELIELGALPKQSALMTLPDDWVTHGAQPIIREEVGLCASAIVDKIQQVVRR